VGNPPSKKEAIPIFFFFRNFNIGGPVNQLIKKGLTDKILLSDMPFMRTIRSHLLGHMVP
jgi:hypothetical protein